MTGVYKITNLITGDLYIGSTINFRQRKSRHFKDLRLNQHHSIYLQRAFNKYGESNFEFSIIENIEATDLLEREQYFLDSLKPIYNNAKLAGNNLGVKHKPEVVLANKLRNSGYSNGNCKLKEAVVNEIIEKRKTTPVDYLADEYNVHKCTISRILSKNNIPSKIVLTEESRKKIGARFVGKPAYNRRAVEQFSLDGKFIAEFSSVTEASNKLSINIMIISKTCNGKNSVPGKYIFKFKD